MIPTHFLSSRSYFYDYHLVFLTLVSCEKLKILNESSQLDKFFTTILCEGLH